MLSMARQTMPIREPTSKTRRQMLRAAGVAGVVGIAGCSGNQENQSSGTTDGSGGGGDSTSGGDETQNSGGELLDKTFTHRAGSGNLSAKHYNPYNTKEYQGSPAGYIFDVFAAKNDYTGEFYPYLMQDWSLSKSEFTLKLRDGLTWWDGTDVTANDVEAKLKLDFGMYGYPESVEGVKVKDDKTVALQLSKPANKRIITRDILGKRLTVKHDVFKDYVSKFEKASSEEAKKQVQTKLANAKVKEPYGMGPWQFDQVSKSKITLKKYEKHPDASKFNWSQVEFVQMGGGNQKAWGALKTGNLDGTKAFVDSKVAETFPKWVKSKEYPAHWGLGLWMNRDDPVLGNRNVRKALAYVFDRSTIAKNSDSTKKPVKIPSGVTNSALDKWLGSKRSQYTKYKKNHQKASKLLKKEGFTKKNGTWHQPNGKKFSLPVNVPAGWSDWILSVQTMVSQLKDFGIPSQVKTTQGSTYLSSLWPNGNFRLATYGWAAGRAYPYYTYEYTFRAEDQTGAISLSDEITVPKMGGGGTTTVKPAELVSSLETKISDSKEKEIIHQLAWVYNQDLPCIPIQEKQDQVWYNTKEWKYPSQDDKDMAYYGGLYTWLPRQGKLNGVTK